MVFLIGLLWMTALGAAGIGTFLGINRFRKTPAPFLSNEDSPHPPISILKPVKGIDPMLEENLKSFFYLDYPYYEILFSVSDAKDAAVPLIQELIEKYPRIRASLIVDSSEIGLNPKVNNLIETYEKSAFDLILISDSNVRVPSDYLKNMISQMTPEVGVVTAVVVGKNPIGLGGYLEALYLNTFYVRWMNLAVELGFPVVIGKSMLFRKTTASRFGGLKTLARYLAEDYMTGHAMKYLGLPVILASFPVDQQIGNHSLRDFWQRHLRWGRIRKAHAPFAFFLEPWMSSFVSGILGAWAVNATLGLGPLPFFFFHVLIWLILDLCLMKHLDVPIDLNTIAAWFLREFLALPHWVHAAVGNSVNWRGTRLQLLNGGLVLHEKK